MADLMGQTDMGKATCAIDDCEDAVVARGWCGFHYDRWHRLGDPLAGGPRRTRSPRPKAAAKICVIDTCSDLRKARGWCSFHRDRWKKYGDPLGGPPRRRRKGEPAPECNAPDCSEPARTLGWCKRHYQKLCKDGDALAPDKYARRGAPLRERLAFHIVKTDHCWFWTGRTNQDGYGVIGGVLTEDGSRKARLAHRVSYEEFVGEIPEGLVIDHLCRNRACVRPDHLEPVLHEVNVQRGASAEKHTHCKYGHEFTPENTRLVQICLTCDRRNRRRRIARKRAARKVA